MTDPELSKKRYFFKQFIMLYESFPCLWNLKSHQYHNRELRAKAYKILVKKMQEIQPGADRMTVVRKINCFRSNVRKEKRKILEGVKSGRVIIPRLWYHKHFDFLNGINRKAETSAELEAVENIKIQSSTTIGQIKIEDRASDPVEAVVEITEKFNQDGTLQQDVTTEPFQPAYQVEPLQNSSTDSKNSVSESYRKQELDRHDVFGKNVAMKLRHISSTNDTQRIMAEKIINEALYMAEMGLLTIHHPVLK